MLVTWYLPTKEMVTRRAGINPNIRCQSRLPLTAPHKIHFAASCSIKAALIGVGLAAKLIVVDISVLFLLYSYIPELFCIPHDYYVSFTAM